MKYKPYPKYKDSGIEWLGKIPEEWEVFILKRILSVSSGDMISSDDELPEGFPIYGGNGIRGYTYKSNAKGPMILIGRVGAKCGCIHKVDGEFWASEHALKVVSKRKFDIDFYKYFLEIIDLNRQAIRTAQPLINTTIVENHETVFPPLNHQEHIATFLDTKTAQIDALIERKQRQIELLKEKRSALITHAVTKGLDPNVKMKDSGIEWIGEIPEGWEVKRIKYQSRLLTQKASRELNRRKCSIALENIESWTGKFIPTETVFEGEGIAFYPNDIIFGKLRPYLAKVYLTEFEGEAVGDFHVMRPIANVIGRYFFYHLLNQGFISLVNSSTFGAKMPRVSWDFMSNILLPKPLFSEQQSIASFLDTKTAQIDALIEKVNKSIDLLKEYRSALITAAVTGKIDVRGMN